jgi:hypothetical protein
LRSNFKDIQQKISDLAWEPSRLKYFNCPKWQSSKPSLGYCLFTDNNFPSYALFGDSHAEHIFHGIANLDKNNTWLLIGNPSCPPVSGINVVTPFENNCQQISEKALKHIVEMPSIHTVVLSFFGGYMLDTAFAKDYINTYSGSRDIEITSGEFLATKKAELFYLGLDKTVKELEKHGVSVIVIIDIPELPFFPRDCIRSFSLGNNNTCRLSITTVLDRQKVFRGILIKLAEAHPNIRVYDPLGLFCNEKDCHFETDDLLLYRDSHHLSLRGSAIFSNDFLKWMWRN